MLWVFHPICLFVKAGGIRVQSSASDPVFLVLLREKVCGKYTCQDCATYFKPKKADLKCAYTTPEER